MIKISGFLSFVWIFLSIRKEKPYVTGLFVGFLADVSTNIYIQKGFSYKSYDFSV